MITRKRLPLHNNLKPPLRRPIKAPQQHMDIRRQRTHNSNLTLQRTNNRRHKPRSSLIDIDKWREELVLVGGEMSGYAFGCPCSEVVFDVLLGAAGLEA